LSSGGDKDVDMDADSDSDSDQAIDNERIYVQGEHVTLTLEDFSSILLTYIEGPYTINEAVIEAYIGCILRYKNKAY
jgi:hypothetical protein